MARMLEAEWLGEHSPERPMQHYDIVCVHTIVGFAPAHAAHFSVHHDGRIQQSRDTKFQSAANLDGNYRIIAIENEDHGSAFGTWNTNDGHAVPALTDEQVWADARILAWAHKVHGVPLQVAPNSKSTSKGLGYHRQGIDGNFGSYKYDGRVSGGEKWSSHFGKVCPGDRRIDQVPLILSRAKQIVSGYLEDDMDEGQFRQWLVNAIKDAGAREGTYGRALSNAIVEAFVKPVLELDGVVKAPPSAVSSGTNKYWALKNHVTSINEFARYQIPARLVAIEAALTKLVNNDPDVPFTLEEMQQAMEDAIQNNVLQVDVSIEGVEQDANPDS